MTPTEISEVILVILGVILSLVFKYIPEAKAWFEGLPHQGIVMLAMVVVVGAAYFGLSCTPFGAQLGISIACTTNDLFSLLKAILIVATGNQLAYLFVSAPTK